MHEVVEFIVEFSGENKQEQTILFSQWLEYSKEVSSFLKNSNKSVTTFIVPRVSRAESEVIVLICVHALLSILGKGCKFFCNKKTCNNWNLPNTWLSRENKK